MLQRRRQRLVVTDETRPCPALQIDLDRRGQRLSRQRRRHDGNNSDAAGLSRLAYDPQNGADQLTLAQSAANAQATINGIAVSSASNTLSGVIGGITFTLGKTTTQPVSVNVTANTAAIQSNVSGFVDLQRPQQLPRHRDEVRPDQHTGASCRATARQSASRTRCTRCCRG